MKIQTKNEKNEWIDCEHKSWSDLKEDGWGFVNNNNATTAQKTGSAFMVRRGYINEFRCVDEAAKSE